MASGSAATSPSKKGRFNFDEKIRSRKYNHSLTKQLVGNDVNISYFQEHGFTAPILVKDKTGLNIRLPNPDFTVKDIKKSIGSSRQVEVLDTVTGTHRMMTLKEWANYFENKEKTSSCTTCNLEFSNTGLEHIVEQPEVVRLLDWLYQVWPLNMIRKSSKDSSSSYPHIQRFCIMSAAGSFTDFHIDIGGTSVWYHVLSGQKYVWLIPPLSENFELYEKWKTSENKDVFFADEVKSCQRVILEPGNTLFIPAGWIHAMYTPQDSIVLSGNFLHSFCITDQIRVFKLEEKLQKQSSFPCFLETHWYALERYVDTVFRVAHRVKSDFEVKHEMEEGRARGRSCQKSLREEKAEVGEDHKSNTGRASNDEDTDVDDPLGSSVQKSSDSSSHSTPKTGRTKAANASKSEQSAVSGNPVPGRLAKMKCDDTVSEKSNSRSGDDTPGTGEGSKKNRNWLHLTRCELTGLKDLIEFLEGRKQCDRHVPEEILLPDELLRDATAMLAGHAQDEQRLAITGFTVWPSRFNRFFSKLSKHEYGSDNAMDYSEASDMPLSPLTTPVKDGSPLFSNGHGSSSASNIRRRRVRCRKCEACTRSECGECPFCKDMKKFGGQGKMKQTCVSRQCLAPILPTAAVCVLCNKGDSSPGGTEGSPSGAATQSEDSRSLLMECNVCWKIVHPQCLRDTYPNLSASGIINEELPNSWECPKCCDSGAPKNVKPRVIKGLNYVTKHLDGAHNSCSSDERESGGSGGEEDPGAERKSVHSANKGKGTGLRKKHEITKSDGSTVTLKRKIRDEDGVKQGRQSQARLLKVHDKSINRKLKDALGEQDGAECADGENISLNNLTDTTPHIVLPNMALVKKYVVRPAPVPPPPKHVQMNGGAPHPLDQNHWVRIFEMLCPADLSRCMRVCKTWYRWGYDRRLWTSIDLSRHHLQQAHLIGIVRRQPKSLDLSWTNVSYRQLRWLAERLPHLRKLRLAGNSWPAVSALCSCACPLLTMLDIGWVAGVYDACVKEIVSPPRDHRPGLDTSQSRLRRCTELVLAGSDITNEALEAVVRNISALECIDLSYCVGIDDDALRILLESTTAQTLSTIVLTGCVNLTCVCFRYLGRFPRLRKLSIEACTEIDEKDCAAFAAVHANCVVLYKECIKYVK